MSEATTNNIQRRAQRVPPRAADERPQQHEEQPHPEAQGRTRTRTRGTTGITTPSHDSYIQFANIPPDVSIEFKLYTATGQEYPFYIEAMRKQGWEPVNPKEHPDWVNLPPGYPHNTVIVEGLILMERPKRLTEDAWAEAAFNANEQMRNAKARLGMTPKDTLTRDHEGVRPRVVEERVRPIPIEE